MAARCRIALGVALIGAVLMPAAQRSGDQARPTWKAGYPSKFWEGTTASERAAIMATLGEIERILWKVPELAQPKGFEILKTAHGGGPPWHPERRPTGFEDDRPLLHTTPPSSSLRMTRKATACSRRIRSSGALGGRGRRCTVLP